MIQGDTYLVRNGSSGIILEHTNIFDNETGNLKNLLKGEDKMNNSENTSIVSFSTNPNTNTHTADTSSATAAPFHHGVPVGFYNAVIVSASRKTQPDTKYDIVRVDMEIEDAPYNGHALSKFYNQSSKDAVKFFRREMDGIGFGVASREELDSLCNTLIGTKLVAQIANHPNGNQVILLKGQTLKKTPVVNPDSFWE